MNNRDATTTTTTMLSEFLQKIVILKDAISSYEKRKKMYVQFEKLTLQPKEIGKSSSGN